MDQMGEVEYLPGEPRGTDWHPHRGFETVTYMIDGVFAHQDSHGGGGLITDGATQWDDGWFGDPALSRPRRPNWSKAAGCSTASSCGSTCPRRTSSPRRTTSPSKPTWCGGAPSPDGGALVRLIAGSVDGQAGLGRRTPITLAHATIQPGARLNLPWNRDFNALVYVLSGRGTVGPVQHPIQQGQLAVLGPGDRITVAAAIGRTPTARRSRFCCWVAG